MELACHEPGMIRQLNHLDQIVDRKAGEADARLLETLAIIIVDFITMAVPLIDFQFAVDRGSERTLLQCYPLGPKSHGAAHVGILVALLPFSGTGFPFGDQCDDWMFGTTNKFGAMGAFKACHVAGNFNNGDLHAEADAQVRYLVLARESHCFDLARDATVAKAACFGNYSIVAGNTVGEILDFTPGPGGTILSGNPWANFEY